MITFEQSIFIDRPPQEVFDYVNDPAKSPKWQTGTELGEWTSNGQPGVGSTFRSATNFLGRRFEAELEVTEWDPPNLSKLKIVGGAIPFESTNRFESQGDGTLFTQTGKVEFGGIFKMAEGLVSKQLKKQMEADISALKVLLESNGT